MSDIASFWAAPVSGNWSDPGKWTCGPPSAASIGAALNAPSAVPITVNLDEPVTLGMLQFGNSANDNVGYTLFGSGTNTLTMNNSGSGATIVVADGTHAVNAPVILEDNLAISGSGTLSFGSSSSITDNGGGYSLTMNGAGGILILSGSDNYSGGTIVAAGTLIVDSSNALRDGSNLIVGSNAEAIFVAAQPAEALDMATVPEPSTIALLGVGAIAPIVFGRRWRKQARLSLPRLNYKRTKTFRR